MDYSDLTYLAVVPSIYSVLEPTLAITLACVPLLRPLFGGNYSLKGTLMGRRPTTIDNSASSGSAAKHQRRANRVGFRSLGDSNFHVIEASSQVELQPLGSKEDIAEVSTRSVVTHGEGGGGGLGEGSLHSDHADGRADGGIMVRQEWEVHQV